MRRDFAGDVTSRESCNAERRHEFFEPQWSRHQLITSANINASDSSVVIEKLSHVPALEVAMTSAYSHVRPDAYLFLRLPTETLKLVEIKLNT